MSTPTKTSGTRGLCVGLFIVCCLMACGHAVGIPAAHAKTRAAVRVRLVMVPGFGIASHEMTKWYVPEGTRLDELGLTFIYTKKTGTDYVLDTKSHHFYNDTPGHSEWSRPVSVSTMPELSDFKAMESALARGRVTGQVMFQGYRCNVIESSARVKGTTIRETDWDAVIAGYPVILRSEFRAGDGTVNLMEAIDVSVVSPAPTDLLKVPPGYTHGASR